MHYRKPQSLERPLGTVSHCNVADMRWQLPEARDLAPLRYLFFTGKGGVGKTSISCALAVALADAGRKVLLVTTDPASNLEDVFSQEVGATPVPAQGVEGLWLEEVDPTAQAAALRESVVAPYRGVLPADAIAQMEEQLSGSCTVEIAAFDRFAKLLAGSETEGFDHIIFDTAPTGHTLRMLELPGAWCTYLDSNTTGTSCLGQLSGLSEKRSLYARAVDILKDPQQCALVLVARPDGLCLDEAARTAQELRGVGMAAQLLIMNALIEHPEDDLARQLQRSQQRALAALPEALEGMPVRGVPLRPFDAVGPEMLRELLSGDGTQVPERSAPDAPALRSLDELVADLVRRRIRLVLVMGKGGIDKTREQFEHIMGCVKEGLARGLSPEQIVVSYALDVSPATIYRWIEEGYAGTGNIELRRKVSYKPRKKKAAPRSTSHGAERSYAAFLGLSEEERASACEMDTVIGRVHDSKCLLTLYLRPCKFQLMLLLGGKTAEEAAGALDALEEAVGMDGFGRLFDPILTDNGAEFSDHVLIERSAGDSAARRARVFCCDVRQSQQKGSCERNHVELRKVLPKGASFDGLTRADCALLMSHVNSEPRPSLAGLSPIRMFRLAYGGLAERLLDALGVEEIGPGELNLTPSLLAREEGRGMTI